MSVIEPFRTKLALFEPKVVMRDAPRRAAVAMVLREGAAATPDVLLIERATKDGDPWSGHMAFPGGRMDAADAGIEHAAKRETLEEVGLSLEGAARIGRLDDLEGRHAGRANGMVISAFVYHVTAPGELAIDAREVRDAFWVPLLELGNPERHVRRSFHGTAGLEFPGIVVGDPDRHVVWGLTYRFVEVFFRAVGLPFPEAHFPFAEIPEELR